MKKDIKLPQSEDLCKGSTRLQIACRSGDLDEVKRICKEEEPFLNYVNNTGNTAIDIAKKKGHEKIVKFLLTLK